MAGTDALISGVVAISDGSLTNGKLADMAQATVKGRAAGAGTGVPVDLSAAQLVALLQTNSAFDEAVQDGIGPILVDSATVNLTYNDGTPSITADVIDESITFAKIQNINTGVLLGRDAGIPGDVVEITLGASLEFTGAGVIRRAALTGDVTAVAGLNVTTIAAAAVTNAKLRDSGALSVIGRAVNSAGSPADILATNGASGVLRELAGVLGFGQVVTAGIGDNSVTLAKMQDIATARVLGRVTIGSGDIEELTAAQLNTFIGSADLTVAGMLMAQHFRTRTDTIADDGFISFTPNQNIGAIVIVSSISGAVLSGLIAYRAAASGHCTKLAGGANLAVGTAALNGTTGVDGNLTVAALTSGLVYIENRSGFSASIRTIFLA